MPIQDEPVIPLSQRHASVPPRWRWWLAAIRPGSIILVMLIILIVGGFGWLRFTAAFRTVDALQTPLQQGAALVKNKEARPATRRLASGLLVSFELEGHYVEARTEDMVKWQQTLVGDTVAVTYHVAKNGDLYIEDWQPLVRQKKMPLRP